MSLGKATKKYFETVDSEPSKVAEGWARIVCHSPDTLNATSFDYDRDLVNASVMAASVNANAGGAQEGAMADVQRILQDAPAKKLLQSAKKQKWEDICRSHDTIDAFITRKSMVVHAHTKIVREFIAEQWWVLQQVMVPDEYGAESGDRIYKKSRLCAAQDLLKIIEYYRDEAKKNQQNWVTEIYKNVCCPAISARNVFHGKDAAPKRTLDTESDSETETKQVKKAHKAHIPQKEIKKWAEELRKAGFKSLSEMREDEDAKSPYPLDFQDVAVARAEKKGDVALSAVRIALKDHCSNCMLQGKLAKHAIKNCNHQFFLLECNNCGGAHKRARCPK